MSNSPCFAPLASFTFAPLAPAVAFLPALLLGAAVLLAFGRGVLRAGLRAGLKARFGQGKSRHHSLPDTLVDSQFDLDSCGVALVADQYGRPSRMVLDRGLEALGNMAHRGGIDADGETGDGAGALLQLPKGFFADVVENITGERPEEADLAVGFFFMPQQDKVRKTVHDIVNRIFERFGLKILVWRVVPHDVSVLGPLARATMPHLKQAVIVRGQSEDGQPWSDDEFEKRLYLARRVIDAELKAAGHDEVYIPSLSARTIVYKGLLRADQVGTFYVDLMDERFKTAFVEVHVRFGTNTFPKWEAAHPYRGVAHNGEINTILGNRNWMRAREKELISEVWGEDVKLFQPLLNDDESDSASLDRVLELLTLSGFDPIHALMRLMPEPWENKTHLPRELQGFFEFQSTQQEPWDGPALVAFAAANMVGAKLDRNGLRPARYTVYRDGLFVLASEVGVINRRESEVVKKGRLKPGQMIAIDMTSGRFYDYNDCRKHVAELRPYADWIEQNMLDLDSVVATPTSVSGSEPVAVAESDADQMLRQQVGFGWTTETLAEVIPPMIIDGKELVLSMGNDAPPAVLSGLPKPLAWYFAQRFAQVTNPPIDALREQIVMSLVMYLGRRCSWLQETAEHAKVVKLRSPLLTAGDLAALERLENPAFRSERISCLVQTSAGPTGFDAVLTRICQQAEAAVRSGASILVLTDRGQNWNHMAVPMLAAVGAVHHHLIRCGLRLQTGIVADTGTVFDVHTLATLVGFGAEAVHPYLAWDTVRQLVASNQVGDISKGDTLANALAAFQKALEIGLLKVIAKMGVSTVRSYHGAQLFTAVGLNRDLVERCFTSTPTPLNGIRLEHVATDALIRHTAAFGQEQVALSESGDVRALHPRKGGEPHGVDQQVIKAMTKFRREPTTDTWAAFEQAVLSRPHPVALRDLFSFRRQHSGDAAGIDLAAVDPAESILRRLVVSDMSDGALWPQVHADLAEAMQRLGSRSGSGEGGVDPRRFGKSTDALIKQWAQARFGADIDYVLNAVEIVIKMAQGAKPGEGGQLPGFKVTLRVANQRHITAFVAAFSPAPHHDIYSIEDIAQVIYDLKAVHPGVRVCVKLVGITGIGAIAVGVAKAGADVILVSGNSGGTGAANWSSIKHAGEEWETALAETHQALVEKGWRDRVIVRVDGGLRTARDVVIAGMLGAEEFGFGTFALMAAGCIMARRCHLPGKSGCPVGVATQDDVQGAKYTGTPEQVMAAFTQLAESIRQLMAELGVQRFDELVGNSQLLRRRPADELPEALRERVALLDLERVMAFVGQPDFSTRGCDHPADYVRPMPVASFDDEVMARTDVTTGVTTGSRNGQLNRMPVTSRCRNVGTRMAGAIGNRHGKAGLPKPNTLTLQLTGSGGQSFGMFIVSGMELELAGDANDGVGKSLCGGIIVVRPSADSGFGDVWHDQIIIGNVALYGATSGRAFFAGQAGERFAVRNSGAVAVVEGVGDHACSFMTRGLVVSIGDALGWNFGSGSSGDARMVVYDAQDLAPRQMSPDVEMRDLADTDPGMIQQVRELIAEHLVRTESPRAREIILNWSAHLAHFRIVIPKAQAPQISPEEAVA